MGSKILVVDDEREIADLVEVYLRSENYRVFKCGTAAEALRREGVQLWTEEDVAELV